MDKDARRRKIVPIAPELLFQLFTEGHEIHARCNQGLPNDARFIFITQDYQRDMFGLCFESDEWEPVPFGEMLPTYMVLWSEINRSTTTSTEGASWAMEGAHDS